MSIAYVNGQFIAQEQATISIMDRGFLFGDGVYEVIPAYNGQLFMLDAHLKRLQHSLDGIMLNPRESMTKITDILLTLIEKNGGGDMHVYLQITRGSNGQRQHDFPENCQASIVAFSLPMQRSTLAEMRQGVRAVTMTDIRWQRCDIKAITLLPNVLLNHQAMLQGANTAILIKDGCVIEGTASNIFIVQGKDIITPPLGSHLLSGITRQACIERVNHHGYKVKETIIPEHSLYLADEVWMTSSTKEITPIIEVDKRMIGKGIAGPVWEEIYTPFQESS